MNMARLGVLGFALAAGLGAFYVVMNWVPDSGPAGEVAAPVPLNTTEVLVAAKDIPVGTSIDPAAIEWRTWPEAGLSPSYITRKAKPNAANDLSGAIAKNSFFTGEPITEAKLAYTGRDKGFMSAILPAGMRAVATPISASTGAGGFILPNDRVDVIMTRKLATSQSSANESRSEEQYVPETILTNIRVLAIDQQVRDEAGKQVVTGQTATLELTADQAEILAAAQRMSDRLTLALRSLADAKVAPGGGATHTVENRTGTSAMSVIRYGISRDVDIKR